MKHSITLLTTALLVLFLAIACSDSPAPAPAPTLSDTHTRDAGLQIQHVDFEGRMISIDARDIVATATPTGTAGDDARLVSNLNNALMGAEKMNQALEVKFVASEEPIEDGLFIFGIESTDHKVLDMEMYDEEGYGLVANNQFDIQEGNNYKAVNVRALDNGTYQFRLTDEGGKELNRTVVIAD